MKTKLLMSLTFLMPIFIGYSQFTKKYFDLVKEARELYYQEDFFLAGTKFSEAFSECGETNVRNDRYDAALCYTLAGQKDSTFVILSFLATHKQDDSYRFKMEKRLNSLHDDPRWREFISHLDSNHTMKTSGLNHELVAILDTVIYFDQQLRTDLKYIKAKFGNNSEEVRQHWDLINEKDQNNVKIVQDLLDENGWIGRDKIGNHTGTIFMIIQHANLDIQEKYLPLLIEARDDKELDPGSIAMLEDRINVRKGIPQKYGTQIQIDENGKNQFSEIFEPENVNERRAKVRLGPIEVYAKQFGIEWK